MRVENNGVACSEHTDRIAEDGLLRIGARCDGTDDTERPLFHKGQSAIT